MIHHNIGHPTLGVTRRGLGVDMTMGLGKEVLGLGCLGCLGFLGCLGSFLDFRLPPQPETEVEVDFSLIWPETETDGMSSVFTPIKER